jgi:signal peptidase I
MTELLFRYIKIGIAFALAWVLLYFWTSCSYREIKGKEMAPGLPPGKNYWILVKERTPETLNVDDVIAFEYPAPGQNDKEAVRAGRVAAMPGQKVKMVKGDLLINGKKTGNAVGKPDESFDEIIVPRDCFFVLMDNREVGPTLDSRAIGPLGIGAVLGRVKK